MSLYVNNIFTSGFSFLNPNIYLCLVTGIHFIFKFFLVRASELDSEGKEDL